MTYIERKKILLSFLTKLEKNNKKKQTWKAEVWMDSTWYIYPAMILVKGNTIY